MATGIDSTKLRQGRLADGDWQKLTDAIPKLAKAQLWLDDTPRLSASQIVARCRTLARTVGKPLKLIVVDYLQLMEGQGETRAQEVGDVSRRLKELAKVMGCPVMALSQLNRGLEARADKRPLLADLRESGDLEADADFVLMLYRDEVYRSGSPDAGSCEFLVRKFREGSPGMVRVTFLPHQSRFADYYAPIVGPKEAPKGKRVRSPLPTDE